MWTTIKSWLTGVMPKVWNFVGPLLKSAAIQVAADIEPIVTNAVKSAATRGDLSGSQKRDLAKDMILEDLKKLGKNYESSAVNIGIELVLQKLKEAQTLPPAVDPNPPAP